MVWWDGRVGWEGCSLCRRKGLGVHIRPWLGRVGSGSGLCVVLWPVGLVGHVVRDVASVQLRCSSCSKIACVHLGRRCSCCVVSWEAT